MIFGDIIFGALAAGEKADAEEEANRQNIQAAKDLNERNYQMFREGRGEGGSALLPLYAKDAGGGLFEPKWFSDVRDVYDAASGGVTPQANLARYQNILQRYAPAQAGADATANGLFNGELENEAIAATAPVAAARNAGVAGRKQAGLEALQNTLNEIKQIQSKKGFTGDSLGNNMLRFNARRSINTSAAADQADANLQNATDIRGIRGNAIATRLANLNLPYNMARQGFQIADSPEDALLDRTGRRSQLLSTFRIAPGEFRYSPLPPVIPKTSAAQLAFEGAAAGASRVYDIGKTALSMYTGGMGGGMGGMMGGGGGGGSGFSTPQYNTNYGGFQDYSGSGGWTGYA